MVQQMLIALMNYGNGDLDRSAIVTFMEEMSAACNTEAALGDAASPRR